jgi:hypothetical protein
MNREQETFIDMMGMVIVERHIGYEVERSDLLHFRSNRDDLKK